MIGSSVAIGLFVLAYRATDGSDSARFDVAIKAGTAVAALVAGLLTWGRLELSRHEHRLGVDRDLTDRYSRAVDQLGDTLQPLVRVGGVFAMERFALDAAGLDEGNDVDWRMALDTLASLARTLSAETRNAAEAEPAEPLPAESGGRSRCQVPPGVVEAVRVLGRFTNRSGRAIAAQLDLSGVILPIGANLAGTVFQGVDFTNAILTSADFTSADLSGATLVRADLTSANLNGANLAGANLAGAKMNIASLAGANLSGAYMGKADLTSADLTHADLTSADLIDATLHLAALTSADLSRASLTHADLTGATLADANLTGARLVAAKLAEIDYNERTVWQDGTHDGPQ